MSNPRYQPLARSFYTRPTIELAPDLLGRLLVRLMPDGTVLAGRIVETEAYLGRGDAACHSERGRTDANAPIWGPPGHAYVYLCYGFYPLMNIVAETDGVAGCVLLRALEPVEGIETMRHLRPAAQNHRDLCRGPGKLCQALAIGLEFNRCDLTQGILFVDRAEVPRPACQTTPRIGIIKAADQPLRYLIPGNPYVSAAKPGPPKKKAKRTAK